MVKNYLHSKLTADKIIFDQFTTSLALKNMIKKKIHGKITLISLLIKSSFKYSKPQINLEKIRALLCINSDQLAKKLKENISSLRAC